MGTFSLLTPLHDSRHTSAEMSTFDFGMDPPASALSEHRKYENPLVSRYASTEMSYVWSPACKFSTWRKLWLALAKGEKELGIEITEEQIREMEEKIFDIDFDKVRGMGQSKALPKRFTLTRRYFVR